MLLIVPGFRVEQPVRIIEVPAFHQAALLLIPGLALHAAPVVQQRHDLGNPVRVHIDASLIQVRVVVDQPVIGSDLCQLEIQQFQGVGVFFQNKFLEGCREALVVQKTLGGQYAGLSILFHLCRTFFQGGLGGFN